MSTWMGSRSTPMLALAAFVACVPLAVLHFFGREKVYLGGGLHMSVVALTAALATATALALLLAGARERDGRSVVVGGAFSVMATLLLLHGLTTPGVLVGENGVVGFTGGATLPVGAALLSLSALPLLRRPGLARPLVGVFGVVLVAVLVLGLAAVATPDLVPSVPEPRSDAALALLAVGLGFYGVLTWRALRTWRLTRRPADLSVAVGLVWLVAALFAAMLLDYWNLGWWLGHGFEVVGILLVGGAVALDLYRGVHARPLVGDLEGAELVRREETFLGSHVRALMVTLAAKDAYTEQHTRRVALRAVQVGEELGLAGARLRNLALGGLLHDIGKLRVPDEILRKPAELTDDEYAIVQRHPGDGVELLHELGGFPADVLTLVRDHHERLDGSGYPRGAGADELTLDARILGACDVYDALVSHRVYREAWSHERAMALLRAGSGTEFDGGCVEALDRVLARERSGGLAVAV